MVNIITKLFWDYINVGKENFYIENPRVPFINGFSLILFVILIAFSIQRLWLEGQDALIPVSINFLVSFVTVINLVFLRKTLNTVWATSILSLSVILIVSYAFFEGASGGDVGILWIYPIPVLLFFLTEKKIALRLSALLFLVLISVIIFVKYSGLSLPYSATQLSHFLFPLLTIVVSLYMYATFTERNAQELEERTKSLRENFESQKKSIQEVSEKKEEALKQELDIFFKTTDELMGIIRVSDNKFIELNPAAEKILGYSLEEIMSRPFMSFVHPEDIEKTQEAANMLTQGKSIANFVNRYAKKDGTYVWLMWNAVSQKNLFYVTARVVDEIINSQEKIKERMKEIEDLNRLMVGREVRMAELKEEIAALRQAAGKTEGSAHL